jgi:hypothetical protein
MIKVFQTSPLKAIVRMGAVSLFVYPNSVKAHAGRHGGHWSASIGRLGFDLWSR